MKPLFILLFIAFQLPGHYLSGQENGSVRELTVLYTNDEHGWMDGMSPGQGAANLYQLWEQEEGFSKDGPFLVLSGGDNFTGPAVSTLTQGQSMVEVMNAMSYDASAVGNHEFDFGLDALATRIQEADYPYLGANIRWRDDIEPTVDLGILPWTLREVNGLKVAIIGLATTATPYVTNPQNVRDLEFTEYETAVRRTMAGIGNSNPDLVFIIAHVCMEDMEALVRKLQDLDIALAGGGHCNELTARKIGSTVLLGGGFHFTAYARASFRFDTGTRELLSSDFATARNRDADADSTIANIVDTWAARFADVLEETVAWMEAPLARGFGLDQLVIDSWLAAWPTADIAITNLGGIRADLPAGEVNLSNIISILPFDNTIISLQVPGRDLEAFLENPGRNVVGGVSRQGNDWRLAGAGGRLTGDGTYTVLVNSFMYAGGDNTRFNENRYPGAFDTGINYRQPFVDWLKSRESSRSDPLRLP